MGEGEEHVALAPAEVGGVGEARLEARDAAEHDAAESVRREGLAEDGVDLVGEVVAHLVAAQVEHGDGVVAGEAALKEAHLHARHEVVDPEGAGEELTDRRSAELQVRVLRAKGRWEGSGTRAAGCIRARFLHRRIRRVEKARLVGDSACFRAPLRGYGQHLPQPLRPSPPRPPRHRRGDRRAGRAALCDRRGDTRLDGEKKHSAAEMSPNTDAPSTHPSSLSSSGGSAGRMALLYDVRFMTPPVYAMATLVSGRRPAGEDHARLVLPSRAPGHRIGGARPRGDDKVSSKCIAGNAAARYSPKTLPPAPPSSSGGQRSGETYLAASP